MDLSIVVVSYNSRELLCTCLSSVYAQTSDLVFEVIVVDNASTDGTVETVKREFPSTILIANSSNVGFARANNQGISVSQGRVVLLLNPDTEVLNGAIQKSISFLSERPNVGIVGCKLLSPNRTTQQSVGSFPSLWTVFCEAAFLNHVISRWKRTDQNPALVPGSSQGRRVDTVSGAFLLVRRDVFTSIGCLDEKFFMYSEEVDFCFRASKAGYEVWFSPKGEVIHHWHGMFSLSARSKHWILRSQILYLEKHFRGAERVVVILLKVVGQGLRVFIYAVVGALSMKTIELKKSYYAAYALFKLFLVWPRYHQMSIADLTRSYFT